MGNEKYEAWVHNERHVDAKYATGNGVHGSGYVYAYADEPTLLIRRADGTTFSWVARLCEISEPPAEQEGVSPASAGGASAPDLNAIRDALADTFRGVPLWQLRQSLVAAGLIPADVEITAAERKPVHGGPGIEAEWDEDTDAMRVDGIGWDLSGGCKVSFAYDPAKDEYYVCVSTSDADQRAGITSRRTTKEQLASLGQQLVNVFGEPDPRDAEIERLRDQLGEVCTALHNQLSDYDECGVFTRDHALYLVRQLGGRVRLRDMTIKAMQKDERERERKADQAYATVAAERDRLRAELNWIAEQPVGSNPYWQQRSARVEAERDAMQEALVAVQNVLHATEARLTKKPAEPRRWVKGDPEPEIGVTVTWGAGIATWTRNADGSWRSDACHCERCSAAPGSSWLNLLDVSPDELVEVVSTDGQ